MNFLQSKQRTRRLTQERLTHAVSNTTSSLFSGIASPACTKGTKSDREGEKREDLTWGVVVGCVVVKLHVQWKGVEFCVPSCAVPSRQRTQKRNGDKNWRNAAIGFQQGILWLRISNNIAPIYYAVKHSGRDVSGVAGGAGFSTNRIRFVSVKPDVNFYLIINVHLIVFYSLLVIDLFVKIKSGFSLFLDLFQNSSSMSTGEDS